MIKSGPSSQPGVTDGLVLVAGEAHGEGIPGAPGDGLHVVPVLHPAGEGRHPALPRLHCAVRLGVLVNEDEPAASEVPLVISEIEKTGKVE